MSAHDSELERVLRVPLTWLATRGPARIFVLVGENAPSDPELLRLRHDVTLMDSPRSATILLVAGSLSGALLESARHVHDQMAHPRRTVWWTNAATSAADVSASGVSVVPNPVIVPAASADLAGLVEVLRRTQYELVTRAQSSEPDLLPDIDPAPWRGVGPYRQGGTGMTGGVPYGRPLAERAPDRDGLELDRLPLRVGPFFPPFPTGFVLDVELQGDLVQGATVSAEPVVQLPPLFATALNEPVMIAELERERARSHLRWLAHALRIHGLAALAQRALRLALQIKRTNTSESMKELRVITRSMERSGLLRWSTHGVGVLPETLPSDTRAAGLGPVARAAGISDDARVDEPSYRALGFKTIVQTGASDGSVGDASARWRQRLAEILQSLDLIEHAGSALAWGAGVVEAPRGCVTRTNRPEVQLYALLPGLVKGLDWGDAVTAVISLDLGQGGEVQSVLPWAAKDEVVQAAQQAEAMNMDMSAGAGMNHVSHEM